MYIMGITLNFIDSIEAASIIAESTLNTFIGMNKVSFFLFTADGIDRALSGAECTTGTFFGIYNIADQRGAVMSATFLFFDVGFVFVPEVFDGG